MKEYFQCSECLVRFAIEIEPGTPDNILEQEYPESIKWLKNIDTCPECGTDLEIG